MPEFSSTFIQAIKAATANVGGGGGSNYIIARVTHVVQGPYLLGTQIPDQYYTDPTSLGVITFQIVSDVQDRTQDSDGNVTAKPFTSALKHYPLEGEFVHIMPGPGVEMNESRGQRDYYYTTPYNLWNASHHNALPDLGDYGEYTSDIQRSYQNSNTTNQAINTSATGSLNMPLGPNFPEKSNIKALRQFTGDVTIEGRWGNSIRFGSTSATNTEENYWSNPNPSGSTPGDPITIIRNGQGRQSSDIAWIPTVENINRDPSSIYLTAGQVINIDDLSNFSLATLSVSINKTITLSVPIQQQLTSIDTTSPAQQDAKIIQATSQPETVASTATPVEAPVLEANVITVVGDSQEVSGTYVLSLRAVDSTGVILASVSATGTTQNIAYQDAVNQLRGRFTGQTLKIPDISKIPLN